MTNQVILARTDSGCAALIINRLIVAEAATTAEVDKLVTTAAHQTSIALRVPLIECDIVVPDELDGKWAWKDLLKFLPSSAPSVNPTAVNPDDHISPPALDEQAQFEHFMRLDGASERHLTRAEPGNITGIMYLDHSVEGAWRMWQHRSTVERQRTTGWLAALQSLAQVDGSPANVSNAEVLAARVRTLARTTLVFDGIRDARLTANMQFAFSMNTARNLEGKEMHSAVTAANQAARRAGVDPAKVGLN